jgi:hypothetical protein
VILLLTVRREVANGKERVHLPDLLATFNVTTQVPGQKENGGHLRR